MYRLRGFTLLELMVTLAVSVILITLAIPGFHSIIQNNRIATQANEVLVALAITRSEALKRKQTISICGSTNGLSCDGAWDRGWITFTDSDTDGTVDAGTDEVLRRFDALDGGSTLSVDADSIQFDRLGSTSGTTSFELRIPGCTGDLGRNITVWVSGSAEVNTVTCS